MQTPQPHPGPPDDDAADDPFDLDDVDRQIRINELTEQVNALGAAAGSVSPDCPPEVHEGFLSNIITFEKAPLAAHFDRLAAEGVDLPHPDSLDDAALTAKLWEVIHALAAMDTFLDRTNHLSDRELYGDLWHSVLRDEYQVMPRGCGFVWVLDILGGCSEEDIENSLRYYDSEESRRHWAEEFPDYIMPPHVDPPYDRDRHLPKSGIDDPFPDHDGDDGSDDDAPSILDDDIPS
jgi:hypothetical protein